MTQIAVRVTSYSIFAGDKVVYAELEVDSCTSMFASVVVYSIHYLDINVTLTRSFFMSGGIVRKMENRNGATGYSASISIFWPLDSVCWMEVNSDYFDIEAIRAKVIQ